MKTEKNENARHTPGPLKAARAFVDNAPDCFVVSVAKWGGENTAICHKEADARLYAAAPELLAALEAARLWAVECYGSLPWLESAEAAIAKAKGETK